MCSLIECDFSFNLSKQIMIDELTNYKPRYLEFIEMLEVIARLSDKACLPPFNKDFYRVKAERDRKKEQEQLEK